MPDRASFGADMPLLQQLSGDKIRELHQISWLHHGSVDVQSGAGTE